MGITRKRANGGGVAIREYIETHKVFRSEDLWQACGQSKTNANLLSTAVSRGDVTKVRRGLYVSRVGQGRDLPVDKLSLAQAAFGADACFAYQSALELHGHAHYAAPSLVTCYSSKTDHFEFEGVSYKAWHAPENLSTRVDEEGWLVTSQAQTFVDCIDKPERACGTDNVLRSVSGLDVRPKTVLSLARARSKSCAKKAAAVLTIMYPGCEGEPDVQRVFEEEMSGCCYLGIDEGDPNKVFLTEWRVYVPSDYKALVRG